VEGSTLLEKIRTQLTPGNTPRTHAYSK